MDNKNIYTYKFKSLFNRVKFPTVETVGNVICFIKTHTLGILPFSINFWAVRKKERNV
jgi:hypothetical protein